eukprot:993960-Rhodomonas_salina.1
MGVRSIPAQAPDCQDKKPHGHARSVPRSAGSIRHLSTAEQTLLQYRRTYAISVPQNIRYLSTAHRSEHTPSQY